ncbi:ricin-type beta-trefoil lectin domain protein [Nonomuraea sp. NPDC046802]|uniref:ricin-type beta-trefoil lectin domain protein n=1 Tax=Nonomuraea sp. NPDC046802 TaxID=3154919 RepID=UPI0033CE350F
MAEDSGGVIYLGYRPDGLTVTIRLFHAPGSLERLRALSGVPPFCTARVLEVGLLGERPFVVSERVEGPSLSAVVENNGPRGGEELDKLATRTLTAMAAIHQAGLVHANLHPGSVVWGLDGPTVTDFGVVRGDIPAYTAPEQVAADEFLPAGDVFGWAATMVFAATGRPPFGEGEPAVVFDRILRSEPDLGTMSGALRDVVAACLSKDPAVRPHAQVAQQMLISGTPSQPAPGVWRQPPVRPPAPKQRRDLRIPIASCAAVVLVAGVVGGWALLREDEPKQTVLTANAQKATSTPTPTLTSTPVPLEKKKTKSPRPEPSQGQPTVTVQVPVQIPQPDPTRTKKRTPKPTSTLKTRTPTPRLEPARPTERPTTRPPEPKPTTKAPELVAKPPVLKNVATGMCLAIGHGQAKAWKPAIQWPCKYSSEQRWSRDGNGHFINNATGMCLGKGNGRPGQPPVQNPCFVGPAQYWTYQNGRIVNADTGLCLGIPKGRAAAGLKAILWKCGGQADQQWQMVG